MLRIDAQFELTQMMHLETLRDRSVVVEVRKSVGSS